MTTPKAGQTIPLPNGESMRVDRVLGEGGMGVVLAATHAPSGQHFALKFLHDEMVSHPVIPQRFRREVELATQLTSQHVARTFGLRTTPDGTPFMVMELLEGKDLCTLLRTEGKLAPQRAARLLSQACEALEEAHAHGIVHRDLKPENLFVTRAADGSDWVKVLDFGISKVMEGANEPDGRPKLTRVGTTVGTPEYMAPEQLRAAKDLDGGADIWSLGCVLYEALSGRRAFAARTHDELVRKICTEDPTPISTFAPDVPQALVELTTKALRRDRKKRVASVRAMRDALAPFTQNRPAQGTVVMEAGPISVPHRASAEGREPSPQPPGVAQTNAGAPQPHASHGQLDARRAARRKQPMALGIVITVVAIALVTGVVLLVWPAMFN